MDDDRQVICGCSLIMLVLMIVSASLFGVSFDGVDPLHAGLVKTYQKQVNDEVFDSGRYFVGFGNSFIKFPTNARTIVYTDCSWCRTIEEPDESLQQDLRSRGPLFAWSKEGQNVQLDVSLRYLLDRSRLRDLYYKFGTDYHESIANILVQELKSVAAQFETIDYFTQRRGISNEMEHACRVALMNNFAFLESFQFRRIDIPDGFDAKVVEKIVAEEAVRTESFVQRRTIVNAVTETILQNATADATVIRATATATGTVDIAVAAAERRRITLDATTTGYGALAEGLGLSEEELRRYIWTRTWRERVQARGSKVVTGFTSPIVDV